MKKLLVSILLLLSIQCSFGQWNTDRIMSIGRNALYFEDYILSIQYFNQVIKVKPYLPEPYMYRAMAKINLGDYLGSEQDCNEAIRLSPFIPYAYYTRGFARKNLEKYSEAIHDFTKALEFDPDNSDYLANRIETKEKNRDYKGAIDDLKYFKKINPKAKGIEYEIGRIMLYDNDTTGAEEMVRKNIEIDSTMELSYKLLAHIKEKKNDLQGAILNLKELKRINPKSENADVEMGRLYLALNDTTSALNAFDNAIENEPSKPVAYGIRAFIRMVRNDEKGALEDYSKAIEKGSEFVGDYINRGILNVKKYNFNQALNDYNFAILLDRSNSLAYYNRALLRNNLGDKNNALTDLERVLEMDPQNYEALLQKAHLELELGMLDKTITDFESILTKYKYYAPAYYALAEAYNKKGDKRTSNYYKSLVFEIVNNKDYYKRKQQLEPKNQIAKVTTSAALVTQAKSLADKLSTQSEDKFKKTSYNDNLRGKVQNNYAELTYIKNADLTFEDVDSVLSGTNRFHDLILNFNRKNKYNGKLKIAVNSKIMSAGNVQSHFEQIEKLSDRIRQKNSDADLYFARAIEFESVQDYSSALEDLNKAIALDEQLTLAYFMRGNVRIKQMEFETNTSDADKQETGAEAFSMTEERNKINKIRIIEDYDKAIALSPDFTFAYYNKGNFLASQKDYRGSVTNYSKAIEIDPNFSEAYFGRGLSYVFLNEEEPAKLDLSKAGELGIYKAYNLLNRLLLKADE